MVNMPSCLTCGISPCHIPQMRGNEYMSGGVVLIRPPVGGREAGGGVPSQPVVTSTHLFTRAHLFCQASRWCSVRQLCGTRPDLV